MFCRCIGLLPLLVGRCLIVVLRASACTHFTQERPASQPSFSLTRGTGLSYGWSSLSRPPRSLAPHSRRTANGTCANLQSRPSCPGLLEARNIERVGCLRSAAIERRPTWAPSPLAWMPEDRWAGHDDEIAAGGLCLTGAGNARGHYGCPARRCVGHRS